MSVEFRDYLRRQSGEWLRNAIAGGHVVFSSAANNAVTNLFGGFGGTGVASHVQSLSFVNTDSNVTPLVAYAPIVDTSGTSNTALASFLRIVDKSSTAVTVAHFNNNATATGTVHIVVYGQMRSDPNTGVF